MVAWNVWWDRNKRIHSDQNDIEQEVFRRAKKMYDELRQLYPQASGRHMIRENKWPARAL